jgi:hypothetical protein
MKAVAAVFRRHSLLLVALAVIVALSASFWSYRKRSKQRLADVEQQAAQAYESGVTQGLQYACTTLDPIAEKPFFIFDELAISWATLVPHLNVLYGAEKDPTKPWTVPAVCGTFPINGQRPPSGEVKSEGGNLFFSRPGEYYLRTTVGDFKLLILDRRAKRDDQAMAIAAFVAKNTVPSMADARKIQPNYRYYPYHRPDKALRKFFATDQPLGFQCGYAAEFLNFVLHKMDFQVRRIQLRTEEGAGHIISEVFLPECRKWAAIDPMYGAAITNREGVPISVEEIAKLARERPDEITVQDIAHKRWLKWPYGNFMHEFTWTPDLLAGPCVDPAKYHEAIRNYSFECYFIEYDQFFRWTKACEFARGGRTLVK